MKVELLGTGAIASTSNSASALIEDHILLDVPNGIIKALHRNDKKISQIDTCIITHFHGDHYFDIPFLLLELSWIKQNKGPFQIIGPEGTKEKVVSLTKLAFPHVWEKVNKVRDINIIEVKHGDVIEITPEIKIQAWEVKHGKLQAAYGYLLEQNGKKLAFTGDTSKCDSVIKLFEQADVVVADASEQEGKESHMGLDNIIELADCYPKKRIITTHMKEETRIQAKKIEKHNIIIPNDGYTFEV